MSTQAQTAANQENAQHSTGPVTEEGKAAASQNNFRYGFTAKSFRVLEEEDKQEFLELVAKLCFEHQPKTPFEILLIERMAQYFWLTQRAISLQNECFESDLSDRERERKLSLYMRYQTTNDRAFHKASDELRKLRNETKKEQIGFESQKRRQEEDARKAAAEVRRNEMHEARLRLVDSKADHCEIDNDIRQTIEAPLPGHMRVPFDTLKAVFCNAVYAVNAQLKAEHEELTTAA